MNSINFEELWGNYNKKDLEEAEKFWDVRADEYNKNIREDKSDLIEYLSKKSFVNKEYDVLDIGCGPGNDSVKLGKICNSVTGIDISSNMIHHAARNAKSLGLDNAKFIVIPWQDIDIKQNNFYKKFDLVFANMTPAIKGKDSLLKMIEASKKYCFMSGFVYRKDKVKDALYERILANKNKKKFKNSIYYAFNILWQMGIYPTIEYKDVVWKNNIKTDVAKEMFTILLRETVKIDNNMEEKINNFFEQISNNGEIEEVIEAKIAWMFWKVS